MSQDYKLRLPDGSEIAPLSLEDVKSWYARGLVDENDLVWKPSARAWVPLRQVVPPTVRSAARPAGQRDGASAALRAAARAAVDPTRARKAGPASAPRDAAVEKQVGRTIVAGGLLLLSAVGACVLWLLPRYWLPALDATPWREIAAAALVLGLLLVRGWELGRKAVRLVLALTALALFPIAGILVAQRVGTPGLLVLASTVVLLGGLIAWLTGRWLSRWQMVLRLFVIALGCAGVVRFGVVPESSEALAIREQLRPERRFEDPARGAVFGLPAGWVALRPEQTVQPLPGAWLVLAQPALGGRGGVMVEPTRAPLPVDEWLSQVAGARPGRQELSREDVTFGGLRGRRSTGRFEQAGLPFEHVLAVARDGSAGWRVEAWMPSDGSTRAGEEFEALLAGLQLDGKLASRLAASVRVAVDALPSLTPLGAETVLLRVGATSEPPVVFRELLVLTAMGRSRLTVAEADELETLSKEALAGLASRDRARLEAYVENVSAGRPSAENAAQMALLARTGLRSMSSVERLARLQALVEKALKLAAV